MKKKDIVISTVAITTVMLMAAVGYSCLRQDTAKDANQSVVEKQIDVSVTTAGDITIPTTESIDVPTTEDTNVPTTEVTDTPIAEDIVPIIPVAPVVLSYTQELELNVGDTLTLEALDIKLDGTVDADYIFPTEAYSTIGEYTETVSIKDKVTGLSTEVAVKVLVVDKSAPVLEGLKDITVTEGDKINLLSGVSAKDNVDGDLTSAISVSDYDASILDKDQTITYSVTDKSGNTTTKDITLRIKSNPVESLDKTMYATTSVNVRGSSSAEGKKVGSLGYAQSVHVTGRDKNTGWYRIEYNGGSAWVSDSYLSDTKPKVKTPSNNSSSTTKKTKPSKTKPSKTKPSSSDCSSDCTSDCSSNCSSIYDSSLCNCNDCACDCIDPSWYCEDDGNCW